MASQTSQAAKKVVSTVRIPPLPSARDIVKLFNLTALRQLSQNFLFHPDLINKIVKCSGKIKGFEVCEVGPGPGNITRSLMAKGAQKITLIEKDRRFLPGLQVNESLYYFLLYGSSHA